MKRALWLWLLLLVSCTHVDAALTGGSSSYARGRITSSHTNINGPRDWNRDAYECKRENTQLVTRRDGFGRPIGSNNETDDGMMLECLTARGWRIAR